MSHSMPALNRHALIVEDIPEINHWLTEMVQHVFPTMIIHQAYDLRQAREILPSQSAYQLALIDLGLPDGCGIDLIHEIAISHPETVQIVTTIYDDDAHLFAALKAGANGYLLKDHTPELFQQHLRPSIARKMLAYFQSGSATTKKTPFTVALTLRETEVLGCIGRGMRIRQAAQMLHISEHTVSGYVKDIYRKLNISSRAEAALEADRRGLMSLIDLRNLK
jgi:DNA-binding NarL/FixJ family response regulator